MTIPLQFASLYDRQEIFMWSNCLLDLGTDFLENVYFFLSCFVQLRSVLLIFCVFCIVKRRKLQWYGHVSRSSGLAKTILQGTVKGGKKTRQTEEKVGRQHQGVDGPGVRQVPEGGGEQRKTKETGSEIICGAPTTLSVKG